MTLGRCRAAAMGGFLALVAVATAGCDITLRGNFFAIFYQLVANGSLKVAAKDPGPGNAYLGIGNRSSTPGGFAFTSLAWDLHSPFRWEVTAGQFDPDVPNVGPGFFCTELDVRGSSPLEFYALCAQPISGGLNVFVSTASGNQGSEFFPGASIVEFAVEDDGEDIFFMARPLGGETFSTIWSVASSSVGSPLVPSIGANNLAAKSQVGFDDFRIPFNGSPPEEPTGQAAVVAAIGDTTLLLVEAMHGFDGIDPDTATARENLEDAIVEVADAEAALALVTATKATKKAGKKIKALRKNMEKGLKLFDKGKALKSVQKKLGGGVKSGLDAAFLLEE